MPDSNVIMLYFKDIEKFPLLNRDEERELARRIRKGDSRARKKMVQANLRLVVNIAKKYSYTGTPMLDLIEEGNIGLMKAVERYDPRKGFRFSTYAAWWIKQYIMRAMANQGKTIRVPVYMVETILKYKRAVEALRYNLKRTPTPGEVAKRMGLPVKKIQEITQAAQTQPTSLDTPVGEEDAGRFLELIEDESASPPDEGITGIFQHDHIKKLLTRLPLRDRKILTFRFGLDDKKPLTLEEVAKRFKITKERVRQVENKAIDKLKELIIEEGVRQGIEEEEMSK